MHGVVAAQEFPPPLQHTRPDDRVIACRAVHFSNQVYRDTFLHTIDQQVLVCRLHDESTSTHSLQNNGSHLTKH